MHVDSATLTTAIRYQLDVCDSEHSGFVCKKRNALVLNSLLQGTKLVAMSGCRKPTAQHNDNNRILYQNLREMQVCYWSLLILMTIAKGFCVNVHFVYPHSSMAQPKLRNCTPVLRIKCACDSDTRNCRRLPILCWCCQHSRCCTRWVCRGSRTWCQLAGKTACATSRTLALPLSQS